MFRIIFGGLRGLFSRYRRDRELDEELHLYAEMAVRDKLREGMNPEEAQRWLRLQMGSREFIKEQVRSVGWEHIIEDISRDICYATRVLIRHRNFTLVAVFALALGIGATTAVYSIVDRTELRPLPFHDPDRLFSIRVTHGGQGSGIFREEYQGWQDQTRSFEGIVTYGILQKKLTGVGEPELLSGQSVPSDFFEILGVKPILGRTFSPVEDRPDATPVVVLGYGAWQRTFGGDIGVIGRFVSLDNQPTMVVGIMPAGFGFPLPSQHTDIWAPVSQDRNVSEWGTRGLLRVYCRIKPGIHLEQAAMDLNRVCENLGRELPEFFGGRSATLIPLHQAVTGASRKLPIIILGAVGLVLLIAVINVANLTLGHAATRSKEIAVRLSIGASRWRVIRQLLTESLLLSLVGGALGIFCAWMFVGSTKSLLPENVPRIEEIGIDWRIAAFGICLSLIVGVISGLYPAWTGSKKNLSLVLHQGLQPRLGRLRGRGTRRMLTICEVSLALILCIAAGLLLKSLAAIMAVDIGIAPKNVAAFHLPLPDDIWRVRPQTRISFEQRLIEAASSVPGVINAAISTELPLTTQAAGIGTTVFTDSTPNPPNKGYRVTRWSVTPDYFQAMGTKLLQGRFFIESDRTLNPHLVVISAETARAFWPGQDPLNRTLRSIEAGGARTSYTVIGVVADVKKTEYQSSLPWKDYIIYYPLWTVSAIPQFNHFLIVRTGSNPRNLLPLLRRAVWSVEPNQPIKSVQIMDDVIYRDLSAPRFRGYLLAAFAAMALIIAVIGIYGIVSHSVVMRTHEMGVRMALGASRVAILQLVLTESLAMIIVGVAIGIAGSLALTRTIGAYLYGVTPVDALTFSAVTAAFLMIGLLASWLPAHRASKADPLMVLRCE